MKDIFYHLIIDACRKMLDGSVTHDGFSGELDPVYKEVADTKELYKSRMLWSMVTGTNRGSLAADASSISDLGAFTAHVISEDCGLFEPNTPVKTAFKRACERLQRVPGRKLQNGDVIPQQVPLMLMENMPDDFCLRDENSPSDRFDICLCYRRDKDLQRANFIYKHVASIGTVHWRLNAGEDPEMQIARATCNSSIFILVISAHTFADINTLHGDGDLAGGRPRQDLANLLRQMDMILEMYEHHPESTCILPVYLGDDRQESGSHDIVLEAVSRGNMPKCWPIVSLQNSVVWASEVRQKAMKYLRLFNKRLAPLLHDQFLRETLGLKDIPSLRGGRQVRDTLKAFQLLEPMTIVTGRKQDAGNQIAEEVRRVFAKIHHQATIFALATDTEGLSDLSRKRNCTDSGESSSTSIKKQRSQLGPLDSGLEGGQTRDVGGKMGAGSTTEAHGMMRQLLDKIKEKSADMTLPLINTTSDHFDLMIGYRVNTEKNTASRIYDKIMLTRSPNLAQIGDRRCKIPQYARADSHNGELDPGIARTFLDQKHTPQGMTWEQVFVRAVANSLVLVPLLSWYEEDGRLSGSVGELMTLHHNDKVDIFLLEIIIANTLMKLDAGCRWLQQISPIFIGQPDARGYTEFPFEKIDKLPDVPSLKTCKKAADILLDGLQIPINTEMSRVMALSVKEHIKLITARQGIKLSDLGQEDIALQSASTKLITQIPALLLCGLQQQVVIRMSTPPPSARRSVSQDSNTGSQVSVDTCPPSDSDSETSAWHVEGDVGHFEEFLRNFIIRCRGDSSDEDAQPNWRLCKLVLLVFLQHNISDMCDAECPKDDLDELRIICSANSHDFFLKEIENLLRAHTPSALTDLGFDFEKAESKDRDGKVRHDTCIFALDKHVLKILSSMKGARRRWIEEVQEKWFDEHNTDPASAYLDRAQKYLSGDFGPTIVGKLFPTSSYVVFLRMNSLTAILMREHCRVQHAIHAQQTSHKARVGAAKKHISSSSRVSFVVSSANWHEWLSEGTCPSKHHLAEIVCALQQIASLPPALLEDNEVPMSDVGSVEVLGKGESEACLNPTSANKLRERRVGDGGGHVEEGASSSTSSAGSDKRLGAPAGGKGKEAASMDDTVVPYFLSHIHTPKYDTHTHMNSCTHTRQQTQTHTLSLFQREWPLSPHWDALSDAQIK